MAWKVTKLKNVTFHRARVAHFVCSKGAQDSTEYPVDLADPVRSKVYAFSLDLDVASSEDSGSSGPLVCSASVDDGVSVVYTQNCMQLQMFSSPHDVVDVDFQFIAMLWRADPLNCCTSYPSSGALKNRHQPNLASLITRVQWWIKNVWLVIFSGCDKCFDTACLVTGRISALYETCGED